MLASRKSSAGRDKGPGRGQPRQGDFTVQTETHSSLSGKRLFSCIKRLKPDEKANRFNLPASVAGDFIALKPIRKIHVESIIYNRAKSQKKCALEGGRNSVSTCTVIFHYAPASFTGV